MVSQGITKIMWIHYLGIMNVCTKCHSNPSNSCIDTSLCTKVIDEPLPLLEPLLQRGLKHRKPCKPVVNPAYREGGTNQCALPLNINTEFSIICQ